METELKSKKKMKLKLTTLITAIIGIIAIIIGGVLIYQSSKPKEEMQENNQQEIEEKEDEPVKEEKKVQIIDVNSKTRPYAVMINCHSASLPQSGLQDAYIVYEIMVESGITRMMALFKDVPMNKVGSIRSIRSQYLPYVFENDAILVHAGGQLEATNRISKEGIAHIDVDGKYGVRDKELAKKRAWEHTLFTTGSLLSKAVSETKLRSTTEVKPVLTYSADPIDLSKYTTTPANKVSIKYSNYRTSNYQYDESSKTYLRSMNNTKNTDLVTGEQYHVKNIIVYGPKYETYYLRGAGYQRINDIGTGEGYYITDGVALPITWSKADEKSQTVYKIKETGEELIVNDGNTYIQIYPSNGGKLTVN